MSTARELQQIDGRIAVFRLSGRFCLGNLLRNLLSRFICLLRGYLAGLFAVFGHVFPIYYGFKGGKGVLTTATVALVLSPIPFAILMLLFVIIVYFSRYVSLGSVCAVVLYPVVVNGYFQVRFGQGSTPGIIALVTIIIAILVVWCHRGNLARISNRTERKLSFGKKKNEDGTEE